MFLTERCHNYFFVCHPREGGEPVTLKSLDSRFCGNDTLVFEEIYALVNGI